MTHSLPRFRHGHRLLLWLLLIFPAGLDSHGATREEQFDAANLLYEKDQFAAAADAYGQMLAEGVRTPTLLFNAGNAFFKNGEIGRAISSWLQAEAMAPRNERIRINLEFARKSANGGSIPVPTLTSHLKFLTLNEWAGISLFACWLFFGLLTLNALKPAWQPSLRLPTGSAGLLFVASIVLLLVTARERSEATTAVVTAAEAVVRYGPLQESQSAFVARDGAEFSVIDQKGDWLRIKNGTGREGWLLQSQVVRLKGGRIHGSPASSGS